MAAQSPPNYSDLDHQKNPYTMRKTAVGRAKTRSQLRKICGVFQQSSCEIESIRIGEGESGFMILLATEFSAVKKIDMAIVEGSTTTLQPHIHDR